MVESVSTMYKSQKASISDGNKLNQQWRIQKFLLGGKVARVSPTTALYQTPVMHLLLAP